MPLGFVSLGTPIGCSPCSSEKFINLLHFFFHYDGKIVGVGWGGGVLIQLCPRVPWVPEQEPRSIPNCRASYQDKINSGNIYNFRSTQSKTSYLRGRESGGFVIVDV